MRRDGWRAHEPRIPENSDGSDMDRYGKEFECVSGNMPTIRDQDPLKDRILVSAQSHLRLMCLSTPWAATHRPNPSGSIL